MTSQPSTPIRLNKFLASSTFLSRRGADQAISEGRVHVDGHTASTGMMVTGLEDITVDGHAVDARPRTQTIMLNKPRGYVVSRNGQGSRTVFDLLPEELHHLKPVGRLDKDSSGLLLMTTDGDLAEQLTHPRYQKTKTYQVVLDKPLAPFHRQMIADMGVQLEDGVSQLGLERMEDGNDKHWLVIMREGRNRQIRRTFDSLGYLVTSLHRVQFGTYTLGDLSSGKFVPLAEK
ncbi:MAG: pseudouridine synthase [Candidatus Saccharibacteria bacterium]